MTDPVDNLQRLLKMIKDVELTRLSDLSTRIDSAEAEHERLQQAQNQRSRDVAALDVPDPSLVAGMDEKWQRWALQETANIAAAIADVSAQRDEQRDRARKAFGRLQAFDGLRTRLKNSQKR